MSRASGVAVVLSTLCLSLAGCGGGSAPTNPTPLPSASPAAPAGRDRLHVLWSEGVTTYRIDPTTGTVEAVGTQDIGDTHGIAGEPRGRYLYAAYGPRRFEPGYNGPSPSIVAYRPAANGTFVTLSEAASYPVAWSSLAVTGGWSLLRGGSDRVHALWLTSTYHDDYYTYVTHAISDDGQLGTGEERLFYEDYLYMPEVDAAADRVFRVNTDGDLIAYSVQPDGRLHSTGTSDLCVGTKVYVGAPILAANGFVYAGSYRSGTESTLCSWKGPRLAPGENLGFDASRAASFDPQPVSRLSNDIPGDETRPMIAFETWLWERGPRRATLRLFAVDPQGGLQPLEATEAAGHGSQLLFHPSGRFLYRMAYVDQATLGVYSIGANGRVSLVQTVPGNGSAGGAGQLAITWSPPEAP